MRSTSENIIEFLRTHPTSYAAAELERMPFKNKKGNNASPKAIRNRLQDAARNPGAVLDVHYDDHGFAFYSIKYAHRKKVTTYEPVFDETGRIVSRRPVTRMV